MNLDLDPAQRRLAELVRRHASSAPPDASGREVLAAAGVTAVGLFDRCLVAEELGASRRGPAAVRSSVDGSVGARDRDLLVCAAYAVGLARRCLELAQERAGERVVGGRPLIEHQGVAHRIACSAFDLADARVGLWRVAWWDDRGVAAAHRAPAVAATAVTVALDCAHETVQVFGAAGTSDPRIVGLYQDVYALPGLCGTPGELWRSAGERSLDTARELTHHGR